MKKDVLIFSTADWDNPFWTNKQHQAMQFAKHGWRVLYIDSLGLRKPTLGSRDVSRIVRRLKKSLLPPQEVAPNIWRASPLVLPLHANPTVRAFNAWFLQKQITWHLSRCAMNRPLIWTYNPVIAGLCAALPRSGLVYHCVDDLRAAPHIDPASIEAGERQLAEHADICFTTSLQLQRRMQELFPTCIYEPNVSDFSHFSAARSPLPDPAPLASISRPRILFVGALSQYKVNFALLDSLAKHFTHVQWILIGATGEGQPDSVPPPSGSNIHVLGPKPYQELPQYMANADAAIIPAPCNDYTAAMFPMKFFEYLAAGLPVISTDIESLQECADLCFLCKDEDAFIDAIQRVLGGERRSAERIDAACQRHSWEARFQRMATAIDAINK